MKKCHVATWALSVFVILFALKMVDGYKPSPVSDETQPLNVQDTITGDKIYLYM